MWKSLLPLSTLAFLAAACSSGGGDGGGEHLVRLAGNLESCQNVQTVCTASEPPQCFDYCADDDPQPGDDSDCTVSDDGTQSCGDSQCVEVVDDQGNTVMVCADPDCVVSHDAETGTDSFECPPGSSDPGGAGSEPGSPGDGSGSDPGDGGSGSDPGDGDPIGI